MAEKNLYLIGTFLLLILNLFSNPCLAQSCDAITLDTITNPGQYNVASMTESDGLRDGPDYSGATIYYPTDATPPFAGIAIVPGYVSPESSIQDWGPFLASHGIVVMTIGTNSFFDDPYSRKDALLDAIVTIAEENTRSGSPLMGSIDADRIAVGGWSMGGGGAQLAAAADPTLKAVVALCPWLDNQVTATDLNHAVPVLIFSGENDGIAPPAAHADIHYDFTPETTNKLLFEIENAGHSVANSPTGGDDYVGKIALSWLEQYLIGDTCYCPLLLDTPSTASTYMTNVICPTNPTSIDDLDGVSNSSVQLYPNPCIGSINLDIERVGNRTTYEILSVTGVKLSKGLAVDDTTIIDVQNLPKGVYYMNLIRPHTSESIKFIVL